MSIDLITLCVVSLAFFNFSHVFLAFVSPFGYQHVGSQNVSENVKNMRKIERELFSILHST